MKKINGRFLMGTILGLAFIALTTTAYAQQSSSLCTIDGQPIIFGRDQNDSVGIVNKVAKINDELSLSFYYNIYYDIGGSVMLKTPNGQVLLLRWHSPYETNIRQSSIMVGNFHIECQIREQ